MVSFKKKITSVYHVGLDMWNMRNVIASNLIESQGQTQQTQFTPENSIFQSFQ